MQRVLFVASSVVAVLAAMSRSAAAQCVTGGTGGALPASNSGDGTWPGTLPSAPLVGTLSVGAIAPGKVLNSVVLHGFTHTWIGDVQFVLEDPSGAKHNILHRIDYLASPPNGCANYVPPVDLDLRDPIGSNACFGPVELSCNGITNSGTYQEYIGDWPAGAIDNVPLESIPPANFTGQWKLYGYDWSSGDQGSLTSWDLCFGSPTPPPPGGTGPVLACVTGGGGGSFPSQTTTDGTWPTSLPPGQLVASLAVALPAGATKILAVELHGLSHSYLGDVQLVLQAPGGQKYNLFQDQDGNFGGGCPDDFAGDYTIVDGSVGVDGCGNAGQSFACNSTPPGTYRQSYGLWPSGSSGIINTDLRLIPIAAGSWKLICYDWYVASDDGSIVSWDLCFDVPSAAPTAYCTAGTSSHGCIPSISATAQPSVSSAHACNISIANVEGQKFGIIFYGINNTGYTPHLWSPLSTSWMCIKAPLKRTGSGNSGGIVDTCSGLLSLDWGAYQASHPTALGNPWSVGNKVFVEAWYRDPPAPKTTNLSNALEMTYVP